MALKLLGKYIFDKNGKCLFSLNEEDDEEKHKLVYGFLQTIISFIGHFDDLTDFITFSTESYQFSVLTLPTDYKIVLITNFNKTRTKEFYRRLMKQFYRDVYVELVVKNPVIRPGQEIASQLFREKVIYYYASPSVGISIQS